MSTTLTIAEAEALLTRAFEASGVSPANALAVARALVAAEVDGQGGHGLARVAAYSAQARSRKVDGHATPVLTRPAPGRLHIDACHGFAYPALDLAIDALAPAAREAGVALVTITRSHHCGQLGAHVERLAEKGLIALMVANAPKAMAPWGGKQPLFGTNPIAFAAPRREAAPLVIDLSLSRVARGKVMAAAKRGEAIPEGWALDPDGTPTTDPEAALKGTMAPAGGSKGAALALMVEILAATLTGAHHSFEASSFFDAEGPPPGTGQTLLALDPSSGFAERLEVLLAAVLAEDGTRLPGTRRLEARATAAREGIAVAPHLMQDIQKALAG